MRIRELIIDKKEPTIYCESFVYEPSNVEEEKFGRLFMVGRIRNVPENSFYLVNLLASRIKREYFSLHHKSSSEALESALKEGNKVLQENQERINWLGNLDFLIATIVGDKINFTFLGKMKALIVRENEVIDLAKDLISEKELFPFTTVLESKFKENDIIFFSTSNIFSKEILIEKSKEILPIEEENIVKILKPEESGVALVIETGKSAEVIERLQPSLEILEKPVPSSFYSFTLKEKLKKGAKIGIEKGKKIAKKIAQKSKEKISPKVGKFEESIKEKKEEIAPRIAIERIHYSQKLKKNIGKIFKQKVLIIGVFVALIFGGIFLITHQQKIKQIKIIETKIENANNKLKESENYIIAGEKEKALEKLIEGIKELETIEKPLSKKEEVENTKENINKKIAQLVGREIIEKPQVFFEIPVYTAQKNWQANEMIIAGDSFYVYQKNSSVVYKWNIYKEKGDFEQKRAQILGGTNFQNQPFFLLSPTSIVYSKEEKTYQITFPYENLQITKLDSFFNNFYIFDKEKGEIIKYSLTGNEISSPEFWFKEKNSGKGATSFAIDGNIYLLYKDGKIKKFTNGVLSGEISLSKTYPQPTELSKIYTSPNNKYLYLLNPKNKRLIIATKTGQIIKEYESKEFKDLSDIIVSFGDKNIYLLANNRVIKISQ